MGIEIHRVWKEAEAVGALKALIWIGYELDKIEEKSKEDAATSISNALRMRAQQFCSILLEDLTDKFARSYGMSTEEKKTETKKGTSPN